LSEYSSPKKILFATTSALPIETLGVPQHFRHFLAAVCQTIEQLFVELVSSWREHVVAPQALPPGDHESGFPQIREMTRGLGLRHSQDVHDVANAQFPAAEHVQDPQPGPVRERSEHQVDAIRRLGLHIRFHEYSDCP